MRREWAFVVITSLAVAVGCDDGDPELPPMKPDGPEAAYVTEARETFITLDDVQNRIIAAKCSPNPNVCHNASSYPDLRTPGAILSMIDAPCNVEIPDPDSAWDGCERPADRIVAGSFESDLARIETVSSGHYALILGTDASRSGTSPVEIQTSDGEILVRPFDELQVSLETSAGSREATLRMGLDDAAEREWFDSVIAAAIGGDVNNNGVWGASDDEVPDGAIIAPGSLEASYLWGRITGTVPGSRMPLANAPLTSAEYVAIACWIETLADLPFPRGSDELNYENCVFAWFPTDYSLE